MDNEASLTIQNALQTNDVKFQLVPPNHHRANAAERAIQTFKNHFISCLATCEKNFPLHLWCRLLPQVQLTLNLLRNSNTIPHLSAECHLNGPFDFNKTPLAPFGSYCVMHEPPNVRKSWDKHTKSGWYLGPAMNHYRCFNVYLPSTKSQRISDTVEFFHCNYKIPRISNNDAIIEAATALAQSLKNALSTSDTTLHQLHSNQNKHLQSLSDITSEISNASKSNSKLSDHLNQPAQTNPISNSHQPHTPLPRVSPATSNKPDIPSPNSAHIIPPDNGDEISTDQTNTTYDYSRHNTFSNQSTNTPILNIIPPEPDEILPNHRYPTRSKTQLINYLTQPEHDISLMEHHFINLVTNPFTGKEESYNDLIKGDTKEEWVRSCARELGRCLNGIDNDGTGRNSFHFIRHDQVPHGVVPTHGKQHCTIRPNKAETHRTRLVVGGDRVQYDGPVTSPTAEQPLAKLLINSTLSTKNAKFGTTDIKDMFLMTVFSSKSEHTCMKLNARHIPEIIVNNYNLRPLIHNGFVYCEITGGMHGLPHAARQAWQKLHHLLTNNGFRQSMSVPGLWKSTINDLAFVLVVDDFVIRCTNVNDFHHLNKVLNHEYETTIDLTGTKFLGFDLKWDYTKRTCALSMPTCIPSLLHKLSFVQQPSPTHSPLPFTPPTYAKIQHATQKEKSTLPPEKITHIQKVIGSLLYYAHSLDNVLLASLNHLATDISTADATTLANIDHILNYVATYPNAKLLFKSSDMILRAHSDGSYLCAPKARSRGAGYVFLGDEKHMNAAIQVFCQLHKVVVSSAAEAELAALFLTAKQCIPIRQALFELGHHQPPTLLVTDNETARNLCNDTLKQKRSKSMDMRFFWIKDRVKQNQFKVEWKSKDDNLADYHTKLHAESHTIRMRPIYIHS